MANSERLNAWVEEINEAMEVQPESTWTIAKFRLTYPSPQPELGLVAVDNVVAAGKCNARAISATANEESGRVEIAATFGDFDMRGISNLIGPFQVVLQDGKDAVGRFAQRYATSLYPLHGSWDVPFLFKAEVGSLIPRPSDPPVLLRSAEPGEYAIPPIGSWFEKWDPIAMVSAEDPDGPTVAVIEHAMHVMVNAGAEVSTPPFHWS